MTEHENNMCMCILWSETILGDTEEESKQYLNVTINDQLLRLLQLTLLEANFLLLGEYGLAESELPQGRELGNDNS